MGDEETALKAMKLWASGMPIAGLNLSEQPALSCCVRPWEPRVGDLVIANIGSECPPDRHLWTSESPEATDEKLRAYLLAEFGRPPNFQQLPALGHVVSIDTDWNEPDDDGNLTDARCHHYYVDDCRLGEPRDQWKRVSDNFAASELKLVYRVDR